MRTLLGSCSVPTATLTVVIILLVCGSPATGDFPVLGADRQATIVYPDEPAKYEQQAYQELASYLNKATGRDFATSSETQFPVKPGNFPIYVGSCQVAQQALGDELAELDRDGFMIVVEDDRAFLVGARDWSTYWAVCQFLEDYVGVRWLIPGPLGEDVLPQDSIVIPPVRRVEQPVILSRQWSGAGHGGIWSLRMRIHGRYSFHHNLRRIFDPDRYYAEHPEYYPIHKGKRWSPEAGGEWQPCMTNPDTVQVAAETARAAFEADPDRLSYSFGPSDARGFCQCPNCLALTEPDNSIGGWPAPHSKLYFSWLNQIAAQLEKTHPDKLLGTLAYFHYMPPPDNVELDRSILPYITFATADTFAPRYRKHARRLVEMWGERVDHIAQYDYAYGMGFVLPRIYTHLVQETLQHAVKHNLSGVYAEVYPSWGLDGPKLYLISRMWWNPDVDVDALLDEWNERMFREAAEPMNKYFTRCEEAWVSWRGYDKWTHDFWWFQRTPQFEVYTPEILEECTAYLDEAAGLAQSDLVKDRIHFFRKTWDVGLVFAETHWAGERIRALLKQDAPLEEIAALLKQSPERMQAEDFEKLVRERLDDDHIAFFPVLDKIKNAAERGWFPVPAGPYNAETYQLCAQRLTREAVYEAAQRGLLNAPAVRRAIERRIREVFGTNSTASYREALAQTRKLATIFNVAGIDRAAAPPRIDGLLDEEVWSQARELTGFTVVGQSLALPRFRTVAKLAYDEQNLYMGLQLFQNTSNLVMTVTQRDSSTYKDDRVDISIRSDRRPESWAKFWINAAGVIADQWDPGTGAPYLERRAYNFNCDLAVRVLPDHWVVELRIPLDEMGIAPGTDPLLRVNMVRCVRSGGYENSAWQPMPDGGETHALPNQGWVILE